VLLRSQYRWEAVKLPYEKITSKNDIDGRTYAYNVIRRAELVKLKGFLLIRVISSDRGNRHGMVASAWRVSGPWQ